MSSTTVSAPKTSKAKTPKAPATKKTVAKTVVKKPTAHPSWKTIISECITVHKEEARTGVSRQLLKKFAAEKYKLAPTAANIAHLNHAITHGAEKGIFLLPKGPSGRVKLSVAGKAACASDENTKPSTKSSAKSTKVVAKASKPKPTAIAKKTSSIKSVKKTAAAKTSAAKASKSRAPKPKA